MTHYNKKPSDPVRYRPEDPNCYTYVDGYGFAPPPPVITERRMLQFYSNGLGFAILLYFLMAASVPFGVLRLFSLIWPVIRVYGNQVVASSSIIQLVNIFSSTICMLVPFLLFMLLCRVPARVAFPMKRFSPSLCVPCIFVAMGVSVIGLASSSLLGRFLELFGLQPHVAISIPQNPLGLHCPIIGDELYGEKAVWTTATCCHLHSAKPACATAVRSSAVRPHSIGGRGGFSRYHLPVDAPLR